MTSFTLILMCSFFVWGNSRPLAKRNTQPHNNKLSKHANYSDFQQHALNALNAMQAWRLTDAGRSLVKQIESQKDAVNLVHGNSVCRTLALKIDALNSTSNNNYIGLTVHLASLTISANKIDNYRPCY